MSIASTLARTFSDSHNLSDSTTTITELTDSVTFSISNMGYNLRIVAEKDDFVDTWTATLEISRVDTTFPKVAVAMANDILVISQVLANAKADIKSYIG